MMRLIRVLFGRSRRGKEAEAEKVRHLKDHAVAMQAITMKVDAMKTGADRLTRESQKTKEAAADLIARLREDFPQ